MKAAILAGGFGTRLAEETDVRPKPMIEIGGHPILWHILKHLSTYGVNEFAIALGYKGDSIKEYFLDYAALRGSMSVDLRAGKVVSRHRECEDWTVHLIDTGLRTLTGGRIARLKPLLCESAFIVTYGDGVADVDINRLLAFHRDQGKIATITAVRPPARFGALEFDGDLIAEFTEKPQTGEGWINGGFIVCEPAIFDYLSGDEAVLEIDGLTRLAGQGQLAGYRHEGFWHCMDTLRDKRQLEQLWHDRRAPWRTWK